MEFQNGFINCRVYTLNNCRNIRITGSVLNRMLYRNVMLIAPNPPNISASYSGTGLPFPCADIAFENSQNIYQIDQSGNFDTVFTYPNSYYSINQQKKVVSSIFFILEDINGKTEYIRFALQDQYPLRTLRDRDGRNGPEFYEMKHQLLPLTADAEIIAREYAKIKIQYNIA